MKPTQTAVLVDELPREMRRANDRRTKVNGDDHSPAASRD